ncbi:ABC transporter permease [Microbacterium sediminicola]|uniref:ABC transporter permease n=1 Tax=Microbacterium sediminicola TaxID=415210 RepID=A0ABP4UHA6_9MICO
MSIFTISLVVAAIHLAVPIILPLLGGLISERSGVMNIALEGMMLVGALTAVVFSFLTGSAWLGMLAAIVAGGVSGAALAFMTVTLRGNQVVASTAINLIGAGVTAALVPIIWGVDGISPSVDKITPLEIPGLSAIPVVGALFAQLTLVDYGVLALVFLVWWVLFHTDLGLRVRACGESAEAADSAGIDVVRTRWGAVVFSGVFAAIGGAYLSIVVLDAFQAGMTQGRGYLALAALVFGKWRVWPAVAACVVFGFADAIALRSQIVSPDIPHNLLQAMPYILALVALATFVGKGTAPAAVGKEFARA